MASRVRQLNVKLTEEQHHALRRHAARRRTPVAWLVKDYIDRLIAEDEAAAVRSHEPTQLAAHGGSFDWLAVEPDMYTEQDGEPVKWDVPARRRRRR